MSYLKEQCVRCFTHLQACCQHTQYGKDLLRILHFTLPAKYDGRTRPTAPLRCRRVSSQFARSMWPRNSCSRCLQDFPLPIGAATSRTGGAAAPRAGEDRLWRPVLPEDSALSLPSLTRVSRKLDYAEGQEDLVTPSFVRALSAGARLALARLFSH